MHKSLETCWKKTDQDALIVAIVVNPYVCNSAFDTTHVALTPNGLYAAMKWLYKQFHKGAEPDCGFLSYPICQT
ncbi:uncharacterized protein BJ212DRAFT_1284616 [Suillus subaureus]|uniref:Uncharacterized protein n=1 Tax=Suillus subaureus TaxID=48587 RepID=A0A9P7J5L7_9AGAM|nr:uncharacterized protein BJ212DRAFT_1284616 [Suillus subaureus]KAG1804269.1 hypothetical protein BJ212DRAFT_1284616 [Suillus subaureus]